jgi:hypothetical protein
MLLVVPEVLLGVLVMLEIMVITAQVLMVPVDLEEQEVVVVLLVVLLLLLIPLVLMALLGLQVLGVA